VLPRLTAGLRDRYTIERELGRGGAATVFLAQDLKHGRHVAIKVFSNELASSVGSERFLREIQTTAQLTHPHILPLHDSGEVDGILYYIMPYVRGESLRDLLDREKLLPVADAVRIAIQVADALAYAHANGVVHRDIKPENLLLAHRGHVWVADFGLAKALQSAVRSDLTSVGMIVGSPIYMSPEQAGADAAVSAATDIYSLGCVLYEMLAGAPPFTGPTVHSLLVQHLTERPRNVRELRAEVSELLDAVVSKALAKDANARFVSAEEFAKSLRSPAAQGVGEPVRAPNLGRFVSRTCNRWKQVNAFDSFFRSSCQSHPARPQAYCVHGDDGEGHESLVERLIATRISHFAAELGGEERGTVLTLRIPWPEEEDLELRRRDLTVSLFREIAPAYMGNDLSATALARLNAGALSPITVIQHDLRAVRWDSTTDELIRWYLGSFWASLQTHALPQLFLIFLKIAYAPVPAGLRVVRFFKRKHLDKREVQNRLGRLFRSGDDACPALVLPELSSVSVDDVKSWFGQNGIYASERRRHELAEALFRSKGPKPMSEIEQALEQIHRDFVREMSNREWSTAW
jgi:serine/threonine protein kinase